MFKLKCFFQYDNKTGLFENCATPSPYDICYSISLNSEKGINKKKKKMNQTLKTETRFSKPSASMLRGSRLTKELNH